MKFPFRFAVPLLAAAAFLAVCATFAVQLFSFRANIERWARRDLSTQAELTAESLREPLATQDFRRLDEIARRLKAKEMILRVRSAQGGWIFHGGYKGGTIEEYVPCGEYRVGVALREGRVMAPFYNALAGFVLAVLVGVLAMGLVFFTLYRQRVRIRELAKLERFRRDFIADFSHELKTPLTGILGAAEMLGEGRLEGLIRKESLRLNDLASSMLDLAKLERTDAPLRREAVEVTALFREVVERFADEAAAKGIELVAEIDCPCVHGDRELLFRALSNLVANALRHSGGTRVTLGCEKAKSGVRLVVADNGVGIPAADRARIFERFHRVDAARTTPGTGLGLAIVRQIARLHGGEVAYEPGIPRGSRFLLFDLI